MQRKEGIAYLMKEGNFDVPCSRYGHDTRICARVAWRVAYLMARETGEPVTKKSLDSAMSMVVNDHSDVAYIIRKYGDSKYMKGK